MAGPMPPEVKLFLIAGGVILIAGIAMLALKYVNWREDMSSRGVRSVPLRAANNRQFSAVSSEETNSEIPETHPTAAEIEAEKITFAETEVARALARLVLAEKIGLTEAVKTGMGKKSGEAYQRASAQMKAAIEEQKESTTPIAGRSTPAKFAPANPVK